MKKFLRVTCFSFIVLLSIFTLTGCFKKTVKEAVNSLDAKNDKAISLGEWNENTYTNDFLNIKYTLPEGWTKHTDEEIAEMMDIGTEYLNDDQKISAKLAELTSVTYLMTSDNTSGNNVILMSEKQLLSTIKVETYINSLKSNLLKNENFEYTIGDMKEEVINNVTYNVLPASASMNGVTVYQKYYVRKQDKYFISIIITSTTTEDDIDTIVRQFEELN